MTSLQAGSPTAQVLAQLWSGQPEISYRRRRGEDWWQVPFRAAAAMGELRGEPLSMLFLCPNPKLALRAQTRLTQLAGDVPEADFEWFGVANPASGRRSDLAEFRVGLQVGSRFTEEAPDVVVPHPWLSAGRFRNATRGWALRQILAVEGHPALTMAGLWRRAPYSFGEVPLEVILAGQPG